MELNYLIMITILISILAEYLVKWKFVSYFSSRMFIQEILNFYETSDFVQHIQKFQPWKKKKMKTNFFFKLWKQSPTKLHDCKRHNRFFYKSERFPIELFYCSSLNLVKFIMVHQEWYHHHSIWNFHGGNVFSSFSGAFFLFYI